VLARVADDPIPTAGECLQWMKERGQPDHLVVHVTKVRDVALRLAGALNDQGSSLNAALVEAGALLHDIAKGLPGHEALGSAMARGRGYLRTAALIAQHAEIVWDEESRVDEAAVVFLADRMVSGPDLVGVEERFRRWRAKNGDRPDILAKLEARYAMAGAVEAAVAKVLGKPVMSALDQS
jgi:hypothetical protein